jgi:cyanate permease
LNLFAASPIVPLIIEDYGVNRAAAGLLVTLPLMVAAVLGLPGGLIIARIGVRRAFTAGWWLMALAALSALAPNFGTLLVLRLAYGLGMALLFTATGPILMQWFQPKEVFMVNGLNQAAFSLGIATSLFTAVPLADAVGWSRALSIFGIAGVVGAMAWMYLSRPVGQASPSVPMVTRKALWSILSNRTVLLLVVADAGALLQYSALTTWLPSFYNEVRGISLSQAGIITGLLTFVGVFAVLLGGFGPARFGSNKAFLIVPGIMVVLGGLGAFLIGNLVGIYFSVIVLGVGSWLYVPTIFSLPMEIPGMTPENVALVWGFIITVAGSGAFLSPLLVGALRDLSGSFMPGFIICAVAAWSLLAAGIFMPKLAPANE